MNARDLITEARAQGVDLWADGEALGYRGDPESITALLPQIKAHKPELLRLLVGKASPPAPAEVPANDPTPPTGTDAPACGGLQKVTRQPPANHHPLTDAALSCLIARTAHAHGVPALAVWQWLDVGDIEGLRAGEPEHVAAFPLCVASAVALGQLQPSGHALTPPPNIENATTGTRIEKRGIPVARPLVGAGMVCCGNCGNWTAPHGDGPGRCGREVKPTAAQGPLCRNVPRYCAAFAPITRMRQGLG